MTEPWVAPLTGGRLEESWDLFLDRYRALIFATIGHYAKGNGNDDVMDAFAHVCEGLRKDDFGRLRQCAARWDPDRPLSTWIAAVVRNLLIDWWRHQHRRLRPSAAIESLPPAQRRIFDYVFVRQRSHVEAYELLRSRDGIALTFGDFLKELSATYRAAAARPFGSLIAQLAPGPPHPDVEPSDTDPALAMDRRARLAEAMSILSPEDRVAVQLYVIEAMPATDVARVLGCTGAKTVYNRVYRALAALRAQLERAGICGGDL